MLEIKGLYKNFGNLEVLHNINLALADGEVLGILGNSGSGKSTLLKILAGLDTTTSFEIFKCTPKSAIMFQNYALFPHLSVKENILFALHHYPKSLKQKRVQELLELFEIESIQDKRIDQISGGQAQRVAFGRAVASECELLLLDEPFSNLDNNLKESLRTELKELIKSQNISAIIVTHDIDDAFYLCDHIALLKEGKIIDYNTPKELYFSPQSSQSQAFLPHLNVINQPLEGEDRFFEWIKKRGGIFGASEIGIGDEFEAEVLECQFLGAFSKLKLLYKHITFSMLIHPHHTITQRIRFKILT